MKILFLSNYFNHHQKEISKHFSELCSSYTFVATGKMREERKKLGYGEENCPDYVIDVSNGNKEYVEKLIEKNDVIIYGSAKLKKIRKKYRDKVVFRYSERPLKNGDSIIKYIPRFVMLHEKLIRTKNEYMLCASAYAAYDYKKFFMYKNKSYKWGYFPETKYYDVNKLMKSKKRNRIIWCGRFLDWKHPDDVIEIARRLKEEYYDFEVLFVGNGELEVQLKQKAMEFELENNILFLGAMKPEQVRLQMEESGILLFTSDKKEGWGAVLNEAMNSGCAVVASHAIGSVPYLLKNNENGLIYKSGNLNMLFEKVKYLLNNHMEQERLGKNAYETIAFLWNADVAAKRFLNLAKRIQSGDKQPDLYEDGPCSKADIIEDDWFDE